MTEKRETWQKQRVVWQDKIPLAATCRGRRWTKLARYVENSQPQGKWKEISSETDAVGATVKEKTSTWNKSCKESVKRESELYKMVEQAAIDG